MNTHLVKTLLALAALAALALPATADAGYRDVIEDCAEDGKLDKKYSKQELKKAKKKLPADLDEYSDCREVIAAALDDVNKSSGAGPGLTPEEAAAREQDKQELAGLVRDRPKPKVDVGGKKVEPDEDSGLFDVAGSSNGIPPPLLFALIAIALLAAGGVVYALRRRIPALARIPLPRISLSRVPFPRLRR